MTNTEWRLAPIKKRIPKTKVPFEPKPIIPDNFEAIQESLMKEWHSFPCSIHCWRCDDLLKLKKIDFTWPIGTYEVLFPSIPAYHCDSCDESFLPEKVRDELAESVENLLIIKPPQAPPINPLTRKFRKAFAA